jgi:hypothetical protein
MGKLPLIAAASAMWVLPASPEDGSKAILAEPAVTLAQLDYCTGPDCRDGISRGRERRYYNRYDDDWRGEDWRSYRGGACRDVAIRERRGDEVAIRHLRHSIDASGSIALKRTR